MRIVSVAGTALVVVSLLTACNSSNNSNPSTTPTATPTATASTAPTATPVPAPASLAQVAAAATAAPQTVRLPASGGVPFAGTVTLPSTLAPAGTQIILTEKTGSNATLSDRRTPLDANSPLLQIDLQVTSTATLGGVPGFSFTLGSYAPVGAYIKTIDANGNVTLSNLQTLDANGNLTYLGTTSPFILAPSQVFSIILIPTNGTIGTTPAPGRTPDPLLPGTTPSPSHT